MRAALQAAHMWPMNTPLRALGLLTAAAFITLGATGCGHIQFNQVPDAEEEAHTAARFPGTPAPAPSVDPAAAAAADLAQARAVLARSAPAAGATSPASSADAALRDPAAWPALSHDRLCAFVARTVAHASENGNAISGTVRDAAQRVLAGC